MSITVRSYVDIETKEHAYALDNLDTDEGFAVLEQVLVGSLGCTLVSKEDGIWVLEGLFAKDGLQFKVVWHEEVGIFAKTVSQESLDHSKLGRLLHEAVAYMGAHAGELGLSE